MGDLTKIGQGGQGTIYRAPGVKTDFTDAMVYKEYKSQIVDEIDFDALAAMPNLVENALSHRDGERLIAIAAWPCEVVEADGRPTGFLMPEIPSRFTMPLTTLKGVAYELAEFQHLLNPQEVLDARRITIDDVQRYQLLREVASGLAFLHGHKVCVGDVSPKNLLFAREPHEAIYFVDCDAMRIAGQSVLPQVETPGWEVPSGEELATVHSDVYKLGLLALRLIQGSQIATTAGDLPKSVPLAVRQIISDTLQNPPEARPPATAWAYVMGHAIEAAQHHRKTAAAGGSAQPSESEVSEFSDTAVEGSLDDANSQKEQASSPASSGGGRGRRWTAWQLVAATAVIGIVAGAAVALGLTRGSRTEPASASSAVSTQRGTAAVATIPSVPESAPAPLGANCGVNLADSRVVTVVQQLPPYPGTGWRWSTDPATFEGNYNACAALSTVLVTVEMATGSSPVTALMFHNGDYLGTATSKAYGFTSLNTAATTGDTVVLDYKQPGACNACAPAGVTTVRYRWQNGRVEMLDPPPPDPDAPAPSAATASSYVRTESGRVRCLLNSAAAPFHSESVICEASGPAPSAGGNNSGFLQAPMTSYGSHFHNAVVDASGAFYFQDGGNIGGAGQGVDTVLQYGRTYQMAGWTIQPSVEGTRFTNDRTGHGMFVAIEKVTPF
ncbi:LppP/LprE family lipoprotein [Mycobacterium sp. M1]|uniref:LppP/LprE family lipoprotein n=1 Tax=Mycolicibacter acidiphilus TaxID=2835306 RepID=A0ABS5RN81_9MYCO|nr:LppP/LprE family lipoprotein [Mycolicibacter acidiphilus]MBS9535762.1 LppP/LprE family lipoprotein [Mycolicibacter acidiphilus]